MRVLITVNDAFGHILPLAPLALELSRRGHDVLLASPGPTVAKVLPQIPSREYVATVPELTEERPPRDQYAARLTFAVTVSWPNAARGWAPALLADAREFRPDLVVGEPVEHAGRVVAAALGVPFVEHGWGFTLAAGTDAAAADHLADLYHELKATPQGPALRVDCGPLSVQANDAEVVRRFRFEPWAPPAEPLPVPAGPRVLLTLGTYDNRFAEHRLRLAAEAVAHLKDLVIVLGNDDRGPAETLPPTARVVRWVHIPSEVERCRLVIHHGGAGTSGATLAAGVPAVCLPQGADQFRISEGLERAGAALVVAPEALDTLGDTVSRALTDDRLRTSAEAIRDENRLLPPMSTMVDDLAGLL